MARTRSRRLLVVAALTGGLSLVAAACGSGSDVASVDGRGLAVGELRDLLGEDDANVVSSTAAAAELSEYVFWESWISEMDERGTPLSDELLELGREDLESAREVDDSIPDDLTSDLGVIRTRYAAVPHLVTRHLLDNHDFEILCSSHLLVDTEAEASAAVERYEAGEDFAALAAELSTGPTGPTGGDLGCVDPNGFVPEFVAGAAAVGGPGLSAPTQSPFGWHVILVRSFAEPALTGHPELLPSQVGNLVLTGLGAEVGELQSEIFDRDIEIDSRYGEFDLVTGQVVPPGALG